MTEFSGFPPGATGFLRDLAAHNDRDWFAAHRSAYDELLLEPARAFVAAAGARLPGGMHADPRVNGSILRQNRDTRFSADKRPYKTHLDLWFWAGDGPSRANPGFFFRLEPARLTLGAGMHHFSAEVLTAYRAAVDDPTSGAALDKALRRAVRAGAGVGNVLWKRVPAPYPKDHARAELLRHDGLFAYLAGPVPAEMATPAFVDWCLERWAPLDPVRRWVAAVVERAAA
jgi:uncharacterized protein (TIGR02453 family)